MSMVHARRGFAWGALAFVFVAATPMLAQAQGRPDVRAMTCGEARALVRQNGAVVLTTGRHTYDRYVTNRRYCPVGQVTERAYVQTRDAQSCFVGFTCEIDRRDERFWWLHRRR